MNGLEAATGEAERASQGIKVCKNPEDLACAAHLRKKAVDVDTRDRSDSGRRKGDPGRL